jgi:hypothetical protein
MPNAKYLVPIEYPKSNVQDQFWWLGAYRATSYRSSGGAVSHAGLQTVLRTKNILTVIYRQMFKAHRFVARKLINPNILTIHSL